MAVTCSRHDFKGKLGGAMNEWTNPSDGGGVCGKLILYGVAVDRRCKRMAAQDGL